MGLKKLVMVLKEAGTQMAANQPKMKEATAGINELINGTNKLKNGMGDIQGGLNGKLKKG